MPAGPKKPKATAPQRSKRVAAGFNAEKVAELPEDLQGPIDNAAKVVRALTATFQQALTDHDHHACVTAIKVLADVLQVRAAPRSQKPSAAAALHGVSDDLLREMRAKIRAAN